jgi:thiol-disulfide isomerase/thioredoxin
METPSPLNSTDQPKHRRAILLSIAGVAAGVGAGLSWWNQQPAVATAGFSPVDGFWDLEWDTPDGAKLSVRSFQGKPILLNFWATWCPPCVEELPLLDAFYRENRSKGWQVLGLAIDKAGAVRNFLEKMPLSFPIAMAGLGGVDLGRNLGNVTGGLPFSVAITKNGEIAQRKMGRLGVADLEAWRSLK